MLYEHEVIFLASVHLFTDGYFDLSFEYIEEVLQVGVDMFGTAVTGFEFEHCHLRDAASALVGGE